MRTMWPKHFLNGAHDRNITVDAYRKALETDIVIRDVEGDWIILSYYYDSDANRYVLDIQRKNSTFVEGWNAVLENFTENKSNKRSDGDKEYQRGWDAIHKATAPDWIEDEAEAKHFLSRKRKTVALRNKVY
jgi:hypothetical protein